jgi:hypothetical protein
MDIPTETIAPVPTRGSTLRMVAAGLVILVSGIAIGAGVGLQAVRLRVIDTVSDPDSVPARLSFIMQRLLELSNEQREQLEHIFEAKRPEIDAVRARIRPEMDKLFDELKHEVAAILTPDQAAQWNTKFDEIREKWRPIVHPSVTP